MHEIRITELIQGLKKGDNLIVSELSRFAKSMRPTHNIERDPISRRTKNGLARVKADGKVLGNPNFKADNRKCIDKANAFAEPSRGTITSFIILVQKRISDKKFA